ETRIAASRLKTRNAKKRVNHSNATSSQGPPRPRRGPGASLLTTSFVTAPGEFSVAAGMSSSRRACYFPSPHWIETKEAACTAPFLHQPLGARLVEPLASAVLDLLPARLDQVDDCIGHRHVVKFRGHLIAVLVGPGEELQHLLRVVRLVLGLVHED